MWAAICCAAIRPGQAFSVVLFLALLLLCIALMMNDTYSTFLYFQF